MITGNPHPLTIAAKVLSPDSVKAVLKEPFSLQGWKILDRWAFNTPDKLRQLEAQGQIVFLNRVLEQQRMELKVLQDATPAERMAEWELLAANEIATEL